MHACARARVRACVRACGREGGKDGDVPEETTYMTTITYDCQEGYKHGLEYYPCVKVSEPCVRACGREGDVPEETTYMTTVTYDCQEGIQAVDWNTTHVRRLVCVRACVRAGGRHP